MLDPWRSSGTDDFNLPHSGKVALSGLLLLFGMVAWFALTAEKPVPSQVVQHQGVIEPQRIAVGDGRVMSCLFFPAPSHAISCDWVHGGPGK